MPQAVHKTHGLMHVHLKTSNAQLRTHLPVLRTEYLPWWQNNLHRVLHLIHRGRHDGITPTTSKYDISKLTVMKRVTYHHCGALMLFSVKIKKIASVLIANPVSRPLAVR